MEITRPDVVNVGWLSHEHDFPKGVASSTFVVRLERFVSSPVNRRRGIHVCEFCPYPPIEKLPNGLNVIKPPPGTAGNGEIRVPGKNGMIYAAPVLIHHYVTKHGYLPPAEFIEAIEQADTTDNVRLPIDSMERY